MKSSDYPARSGSLRHNTHVCMRIRQFCCDGRLTTSRRRERGQIPGQVMRTRARRVLGAGATTLALLMAVLACSGGDTSGAAPSQAAGTASGSALALPRVPWEGGPRYWSTFPKTAAAGWTDPTFFPVVIWFDGISTDGEVEFDKAHGINTYVGVDPSTQYRLFADHGVYWIGRPLDNGPADGGTSRVGYFLDDEADGRFSPASAGLAHLKSRRQALPGDRFAYANYTYMVVARDLPAQDAVAFVNDVTDVVSVDMYWYTVPFCSRTPFHSPFLVPIRQQTCRTSSSYGAVMDALRQRDAVDGKLQPLWQFVELLNGGGAEGPFVANIKPDQVRGAVMSSLIHEARGIVYFNQSLTGPCRGGNVIRMAQVRKGFCGASQVAAAGEINRQIHLLAPVLNTQSYAYTFGPGLDTMLKVHDGNAYVFAMVDGSGPAGERRFTLPRGLDGEQIEVLFENRRLQAHDGTFRDSFAAEDSYHIYRIPLSGSTAGR